jgi:hypothetical protein
MSIISMEAIQAAHFLDMNTMPMVPMGSKVHTILILATQICTKELKLICLARTSTRLPGQQETIGAMDLQLQSMPNHLKLFINRCHLMMVPPHGVLAITDRMDNSLLVSV